jgi:carbon-monoxide dehydrogenase large subunit
VVPVAAVDGVRPHEGGFKAELTDSPVRLGDGRLDVVRRQHRRPQQPLGVLGAELGEPVVVGASDGRGQVGLHPVHGQDEEPMAREEHGHVDALPVHGLELRDRVVAPPLGVLVAVGLGGLGHLQHPPRERCVGGEALALPLDGDVAGHLGEPHRRPRLEPLVNAAEPEIGGLDHVHVGVGDLKACLGRATCRRACYPGAGVGPARSAEIEPFRFWTRKAMTTAVQVGQPLKRREDLGLLTGRDRYVADLPLPGALHLAVVRSPHAHAEIRRITTEAARRAPGVVGVFTGADLDAALGEIPMIIGPEAFDEVHQAARPVLAEDRVRCMGQPVAVVIAESAYAAQDAADLVDVEYAPLPAVTDAEAALQSQAPRLYPHLPSNLGVRWARSRGDVDRIFAEAPVVVEARMVNQRLLAVAMEPRGVAAAYDTGTGQLTVWGSTQTPHWLRDNVAKHLQMPPERVRVVAPRVGGGFGAKIALYPEDLIVPWLARRLGRSVRWAASRREDLLATSHGRDVVAHLRLAADRTGRILGLDATITGNLGFCLFSDGPILPVLCGQMITGCYDIPVARVEVRCAFTNTMGTAAYRGAGRPEAAYFIERMIHVLAAEIGLDPAEVRRRNFIPPDRFPYETTGGASFDSGKYARALDLLLERADYARLRAEQARAGAAHPPAGRPLVGIGLASYVEMCAFVDEETSDVVVEPDGRVTVLTGCSPHGQGHETSFAQLVADELGVSVEAVSIVHSDTARVRKGQGTYGSRSIARGGMAAVVNARRVAERARRIAAHLLEARPDDIVREGPLFHVRGVPGREVAWAEIAAAAHSGRLPAELGAGLAARDDFVGEGLLYPFGSHLAVVEVDPDTGAVHIRRYMTVDDSGVIVNPLLAAGQVHGGLAQGIGQALWEAGRYDADGQLVSGSLMDYAIPKADDLPSFETGHTITPSPRTPLGVKGIGESATIGSTPAIANAVMDALAPLGVRHLDLPLTPDKIWRAIADARACARNPAT